ncbi:Srb8, subunit of the RNA polymerase II mediator complex [Cryphonectria parasitica EP155]|uniref:Mediator of RNA polymerase II transcription subunit 12 n=1 Tax=Cryphonectria parasitica (strain ATCC 38755 / EP155) TaxID=660469 RepID=A0A9P5CP59_CRYP1|nr:Srb8, subunit of the RNA polymerase II mediator complex [Cryphonectria parasitica EP155]KAF3765047.1 Srb8, subunit of the RNA polymerase II mediator complex [Cryphonectria parasitica EP155]
MSSRASIGVPQRQPPSRSLSSSGTLSQRPAHKRTLSSQYLPPSPVRNNSADFPPSSSDPGPGAATTSSNSQAGNVAQTQYGTPRRGGSRLRLELANDGITHSGFVESPTNAGSAIDLSKPFTPSRRGLASADNSDNNPPLPMPRRRCRFALPDLKKHVAAPAPAPVKKDNRPKPYSIEAPPAAPRWALVSGGGKDSQHRSASTSAPSMGHADFSPWTGDGPEDHFTQSFIQNGYFDKGPFGQAENGTGKSAIFPSLKHKTGLYALSTVFTGLLGARRHSGQITSPSTFKPPPRVTVTDTKREAWLKDLANPASSLRRLSRTVPHGIRGKGLLDQCLNKNMPTDRAVWLAKCVGANEIRAFKRKGVNGAVVMGGEAKWIRDWTVFVEQFVDGVVASFGDPDWKNKVNYAVRLATQLYAEHLLDREHYMEWVVLGIENCPNSKLPMYLLIMQIYWKDLLRLRKYGRRLVAALLSQYSTIQNHPDRDIFAPLAARLVQLIKTLVLSTSVNFVSPSTWPKHKDVLAAALPADDSAILAAHRVISSRNEQLLSSARAPAARGIMVKHLDGALQAPIPEDLPIRCWNMFKGKDSSVRTTLEWCTSSYRPGLSKIYIAHRLLSAWAGLGLNTTDAVLGFMTALYHLVSELVRSGHFEPMAYMQWLIARGGLYDSSGVDQDGPATTRLLVELPIFALPDSLRTMRANMLGRAGYSVDDEATNTEMAVNSVKSSLGLHWTDAPQTGSISVDKLCRRIRRSSRALKVEVGQCLRRIFVLEMAQAQTASKEVLRFPTPTFLAARSILEAAEDFRTLGELLKTASDLFDADILSSCADTLNLHLPTLCALGIAKDVFESLVKRLGNLSQTQGVVAVRPLLTSMAMLVPRIPGQDALVNHLNDAIRNDRNSAVDASSPVSDNMAARIQDEEGELLDEIEKRLANKTSMDRTTMNSFLNKIIPKIQACWLKADERLRAYGSLLARLRYFDTQHFDSFMTKWVLGIRNPQSRPPLGQIFPLMVVVGCLNFSIILTTTGDAVSVAARPNMAAKAGGRPQTYVQEVLELFTAPPSSKELLTPEEAYRFRILQAQAPKTHFKEMVVLVRNALAEYCSANSQEDASAVPLANEKARDRLEGLLRSLVLIDQQNVPKLLNLKALDPAVGKMLDSITTRLLLPDEAPGRQFTFEQVLGLANELTLPFCQLKLNQCMAMVETSGANAQDRLQTQLEVYSKAMDDAIDSHNITWTGILPWLPAEVSQHLLTLAQTRLFNLLPSMKNLIPADESFAVAETLLSVIDILSRGRPTQLASNVVDRLADLWEVLASPSDEEVKIGVLLKWLPLMLSLLALHAPVQEPANKQNGEVRGRALLVLTGLLQELEGLSPLAICNPDIPSNHLSQLTQRTFDLALLLVDTLPDEARQQCIRHLRDALSDPRLRYIFSYAPQPHDNLMLAHKDKPATPAGQRPRGGGGVAGERLGAFTFRRWEILNEPTPNIGENDTSLDLRLFEGIKLQ